MSPGIDANRVRFFRSPPPLDTSDIIAALRKRHDAWRAMIGTCLLDRYEVVAELGRGGMGVVYRARDPMLNRDVAVKLIPPMLLTPDAEERLQREAQVVAQMNHPSIVSIYDIGRHEGSLFFLMPVVGGKNLRRFLSEPRSVGEVLEIVIRVAEALEYSHARGVVHRDIKPENIMVSEEDGVLRVYVMDFGLAKASSDSRLTKTGALIGTVAYFSPEQVVAKQIDHRSDIYSLGVVLYECLGGEPPFTGEVQSLLYRIVHEFPRPPRSFGINIAQELEEIVLCCLEKDPARRYQRASELATALRRCQSRLQESEKSVVLSAVMTAQMQRPSVAELIDREKEFAELQRRLNAAAGGECQFVVVGGEAGIGKSRLVEELENLARARKVRVVRGRFGEQTRAFAHQAFAGLIQDYFRSRDAGSSSGETADFSDLAPELMEVFPSLSEISAIRGAASSSAYPAAERRRDDTTYVHELLARTLTRIAGGKPLLVVFENLHVAETSLEAIQYLIQRLAATPLLVAGTYRQTDLQRGHPLLKMIDGFADDPRFASIILGPLTPSHHQEYVAAVVGARQLAPGLLQRIYKATEGNPFFTRELVRSLIESGGIVRDESGTWTLSGEMAISSDALPATIQQAVEKRIERLPEDAREILSIASILGKSFDYENLEVLVDEQRGLDKSVDRLVADGLLEEDRESRGDRMTFTSGIVRDVLYGRLSRRRRRTLHKRYAEHLEERHAKRLDAIYPQLVHHFSEADVPEKTVEYGLKQARRALDSFGAEEAVQVIRIVLDFVGDERGVESRSAEAEARMMLAEAHRLLGAFDAALREADAALRLLEREKESEKAAEAIAFAAEAAWQARRIDETRRWLERGIELARTASRSDILAKLLSLGATVANLRSEYQKAKIYLDEVEKLSGAHAVPRAGEEPIPSGGTLRSPIANLIVAEEPALLNTNEDAEILALVFENLVTTDSEGRLVADLAQSWELLEEGQSLRIILQPGSRFSDGSSVTAADVKASFERAARARSDKIPAALELVTGIEEYRAGTTSEVRGVRVVSDREMVIALNQPLAIYPALLTDPTMAIMKVVDSRAIGTGPFVVAERSRSRTVVERNEKYRKGSSSKVDRVEFRVVADTQAIASAFRKGEIELARDLPQRDLDEILRDPRLSPAYVEAPRSNTYFVLFNQRGPLAFDPALRRALAGSLRVHELVWRAVGRLVQPAPSLVPPSIFGHDPGRRRDLLTRDEAGELLKGVRQRLGSETIRLAASAHPTFHDRYAPLVRAITDVWKDLGVEIEMKTTTTEEYLASFLINDAIDILFGRWNADYDDADNFTYGLFYSDSGVFRRYFCSPETDAFLKQARTETNAMRREALYRTFENALASSAMLVPLFYEINYRIAARTVRGIRLRSTRPYVNYAELGVAPEREERPSPILTLRATEIHVPIIEEIRTIDPARVVTFNEGEVMYTVFESLMRCREGARIVPWLVSNFAAEDGGLRYRFRLREDVRFHDGRRLTARDVRFSWERRLSSAGVSQDLRCIRGATEFMRAAAKGLEGFRIVASHEFVLELEKPLAMLPALLSLAGAAIVPEGTEALEGTWRDGFAGTGPFRVVDFQRGKYIELERNPTYWREGLPKCERIVFHFGFTPDRIRDEFLKGNLSIASDLSPDSVEALLRDPSLASGYRAVPRLSIYFVALNRHSPQLADPAVRRALIHNVDVEGMVRRTLGRVAVPAAGVIPPGLLGHTGLQPAGARSGDVGQVPSTYVNLRAAVQPLFFGQYARFTEELRQLLGSRGVTLVVINKSGQEYIDAVRLESPEIVIGRWIGTYPDSDYFTYDLIHSDDSFLGRIVGTPAVDVLIERARREPDTNVRNALYRQIEDLVASEALMLPLFYEQAYRFVRPEIAGLSLSFTPPEVAYDELIVRR